MLDVLLLLLALSLFGYAFYKWATKNEKHFENLGVAYIKPTLLFGSLGRFFTKQQTALEFSDMLYYAYPLKKIYGVFLFREPAIVIRDPETIKRITIKDFEYFQDKRLIGNDSDKLLGNSLIMLKGDKWHDMRATLSPAFTGSKMRTMFDLIIENSIDMSNNLKEKVAKTTTLDICTKELFNKITTDLIANSAFGIKINSFENDRNEFYVMASDFLNFAKVSTFFRLLFLTIFPKLANILDVGLFPPRVCNFFKDVILSNIATREKENIVRPDVVNMLMQIRKGKIEEETHSDDHKIADSFASVDEIIAGKKQIDKQFTDDEIVAQCFLFFFAGFDPLSNHLSFASHELAANPDVQQKLFEEISAAHKRANGKKISYEQLQKMKYLDMVMSEALRKWPSIGLTDRICVNDYVYEDDDGTKIPIKKGMTVVIPSISLHYDEKYFPNSQQFDPERFNDDNKKNIIVGTYLPFGIGPRNCIGSRLALMEAKIVIFYLLLNFKLVPYEKTQIPLKLAKTPMGMFTEKGIYVRLEPR